MQVHKRYIFSLVAKSHDESYRYTSSLGPTLFNIFVLLAFTSSLLFRFLSVLVELEGLNFSKNALGEVSCNFGLDVFSAFNFVFVQAGLNAFRFCRTFGTGSSSEESAIKNKLSKKIFLLTYKKIFKVK